MSTEEPTPIGENHHFLVLDINSDMVDSLTKEISDNESKFNFWLKISAIMAKAFSALLVLDQQGEPEPETQQSLRNILQRLARKTTRGYLAYLDQMAKPKQGFSAKDSAYKHNHAAAAAFALDAMPQIFEALGYDLGVGEVSAEEKLKRCLDKITFRDLLEIAKDCLNISNEEISFTRFSAEEIFDLLLSSLDKKRDECFIDDLKNINDIGQEVGENGGEKVSISIGDSQGSLNEMQSKIIKIMTDVAKFTWAVCQPYRVKIEAKPERIDPNSPTGEDFGLAEVVHHRIYERRKEEFKQENDPNSQEKAIIYYAFVLYKDVIELKKSVWKQRQQVSFKKV